MKNPLKPIKAIIKDIRPEAEGVKTYTLSTEFPFVAEPGQFNMIGYPGVGEAPISLSAIMQVGDSTLRDGSFKHTIKSVGRVTDFLKDFKKGDELFFRGPYGRGWPVKKAEKKDVLIVAGGVGLAPLRPVIQKVLNQREFFGDVSLIYGARNEKNMLFMDEFKIWEKDISLYITVDEVSDVSKSPHPPFTKGGRGGITKEWSGGINVGLVTDLLDRVKIQPERTIAFVCGPEIMMRFVCRGLIMHGMLQSSLYVSLERRMKCGIAQCGHCQHSGLFVCKDGPVFSYKEVRGLPDGVL
ncbi:MAG: FAD/NAD(P)-binding protein [Thermodesulfovibrionales bacterium]|nr:FAD/NAD(P)-binding protein [Thermodesulfovibrionales bacterium]